MGASSHGPNAGLMSSIYRPKSPHFSPDHEVRTSRHVDTTTGPAAETIRFAAPEDKWSWVRKARPLNTLLPATVRWLECLAPDVRPSALATQFPRIANRLAAEWVNPETCRAYLYELLTDTRGGRKGFPEDVLGDLLALHVLYSDMHPESAGMRFWRDR